MRKFKKISPLLVLLSLILLICASIFVPYLIEKKAFVIGYDLRTQYRPLFTEFRRLLIDSIKNMTLPFWSWNMFFGNNFWAAKAYYIFGDIYSYIGVLIKAHYYHVFMILAGLKFIGTAISFYVYGTVRKWHIHTRILGALLFTFTAWSLKYVESAVFLSFYSFVPLYFASLELSMQKKHRYTFAIMVAIMLATNFYLFYTLSIFTLVYYTYRYFETNAKGYFKNAWSLIAYYLVGILLSSFIIVPGFLLIMQNSRLFKASGSWYYFDNVRIYFHMLIATFVPSSTFISQIVNINGIEQYTSIYESLTYQTRELLLWGGSLTSLFMIQSLFGNKKTLHRILYLSMFIVLILPIGGSIMHGFSEHSFRWTLFFIFMNILIAMNYVENPQEINFKVLKLSAISITVLILINIPILSLILKENPFDYYYQWGIFGFTIIIYWSLYLVTRLSKLNMKIGFIIITVIELLFASYLTFNMNPNYKKMDWDFVVKSESVLGYEPNQLNRYLEELDGDYGYYRIYAPFDSIYWMSSLNMNLIYNFSDIKTYDSTYQYSVDDLTRLTSLDRGFGWSWNITQPDIVDFASVKYAIVTSEAELPHTNFEYVGDFNGLGLYLNKNYKSIANTYNSVISYDEYSENPNLSLINNTIIANTKDVSIIKTYLSNSPSVSIMGVENYQNLLLGSIKSEGKNFVVTSIAYDLGWKITVNGQEVPYYKVNGGFIGFPVEAGTNSIKMYFMSQGFKLGVLLSGIGGLILSVLMILELKIFKKRHTIKKKIVEIYSKNYTKILILFIPIIFIIPMLFRGIPSGHDLIYHFSRIVGTLQLWNSNIFSTKILPGFYSNYGYAVNIFYPLGLFYIPVILMKLGLDLITSYKIFAFLITLGTTVSMFYSIRYILKSNIAGLVASLIYTLSVYRTYTDFFERAALGEWVAFMFVPLAFVGLYKIIHDEKPSWIILTLGMTGLILTHTITTILMIYVLTAYALLYLRQIFTSQKRIKQLIIAVFLTVLFTAFYWLPLLEMMSSDVFQYQFPWTNLYENFFSGFNQLFYIIPQWSSFPNGVEFWLIIIVLFYIIVNLKEVVRNKIIVFSIFIITLCIIVESDLIPHQWLTLISFIQFPYRLTILIVFFISLVFSYFFNNFFNKKRHIALIGLFIFVSAMYIYNTSYYYNVRMIGYWYDQFPRYSIEHFYAEFLPESADMDALVNNEQNKQIVLSQSIDIAYTQNQLNYVIDFNQNDKIYTQIEVPLLHYIGYAAKYENNGKTMYLPVNKSTNSLLSINLGNLKNGRLYVYYQGTSIQTWSQFISIITFISILIYQIYKYLVKRIHIRKDKSFSKEIV